MDIELDDIQRMYNDYVSKFLQDSATSPTLGAADCVGSDDETLQQIIAATVMQEQPPPRFTAADREVMLRDLYRHYKKSGLEETVVVHELPVGGKRLRSEVEDSTLEETKGT